MVKSKFKEMSVTELRRLLIDNRGVIISDIVKKSLGNLKNTANIRLLKRDNARILTILNGKNRK